jgi:hypothetical protein
VKLTCSVGNLVFSHFFGRLFGFPLKTEATPHGILTEYELFGILDAIFCYLFFNADEVLGLKLKTITVGFYKQMSDLLKINIDKIKAGGAIESYIDKHKAGDDFMHLFGENLIRRMVNDRKNSHDEIVTQILLTAPGLANMSAEVSTSLF